MALRGQPRQNVMLEAGVSFLGVGIDLPTASWGTLLTAAWGSLLSPFRYDPLTFSPSDLAGGLDRHNWQRVMEALALARGKRLVVFDPPEAGS